MLKDKGDNRSHFEKRLTKLQYLCLLCVSDSVHVTQLKVIVISTSWENIKHAISRKMVMITLIEVLVISSVNQVDQLFWKGLHLTFCPVSPART